MKMRLLLVLLFSLTTGLWAMPRENVIDVPAIKDGLSVHNLFQSNMILQRDKPIYIWGWAKAGANVEVSFNGEKKSTTAEKNRRWKVTLSALPASTSPRKMTISSAGESVTLDNILMGDVWILGGQSNMEFPLVKVENGHLEIVSANYPHLRMLTPPVQEGPKVKRSFARMHEWSGWFRRHFRKGDWDVCTPEKVREMSAIGYVFARRLQQATQIPIAVIDTSRGGTTVEAWTPISVVRKIKAPAVQKMMANWDKKTSEWDAQKDLDHRIKKHKDWLDRQKKANKEIPEDKKALPSDLRPGPAADRNHPGNCFAGLMGPVIGLSVKGAIYHQGYNNANPEGVEIYEHVFPEMIKAWRKTFNDPNMPFGILSMCTADHPQNSDNYVENMANEGPYIREAQYKTFLDFQKAGDKNIGFASSYDLRRRWYHPHLKIPAGERLARWALATQYGFEKQLQWKPPAIKKMDVEKGRLVLHFDHRLKQVDDAPFVGFAIAGEDRKFQPAKADFLVTGKDGRGRNREDQNAIVLTSPLVPNPIHFRFAWARNPMGNVQAFMNKDLPIATQRSDNWKLNEVPLEIKGKNWDTRRVRNHLKGEDKRRLIWEAEDYLKKNKK